MKTARMGAGFRPKVRKPAPGTIAAPAYRGRSSKCPTFSSRRSVSARPPPSRSRTCATTRRSRRSEAPRSGRRGRGQEAHRGRASRTAALDRPGHVAWRHAPQCGCARRRRRTARRRRLAPGSGLRTDPQAASTSARSALAAQTTCSPFEAASSSARRTSAVQSARRARVVLAWPSVAPRWVLLHLQAGCDFLGAALLPQRLRAPHPTDMRCRPTARRNGSLRSSASSTRRPWRGRSRHPEHRSRPRRQPRGLDRQLLDVAAGDRVAVGQEMILSISLERAITSSPQISTSARAASGSTLAPRRSNSLRTRMEIRGFGDVELQHLAVFSHRLAEVGVFGASSATRRGIPHAGAAA